MATRPRKHHYITHEALTHKRAFFAATGQRDFSQILEMHRQRHRRRVLATPLLLGWLSVLAAPIQPVPDKLVVLTFDDAVESQSLLSRLC